MNSTCRIFGLNSNDVHVIYYHVHKIWFVPNTCNCNKIKYTKTLPYSWTNNLYINNTTKASNMVAKGYCTALPGVWYCSCRGCWPNVSDPSRFLLQELFTSPRLQLEIQLQSPGPMTRNVFPVPRCKEAGGQRWTSSLSVLWFLTCSWYRLAGIVTHKTWDPTQICRGAKKRSFSLYCQISQFFPIPGGVWTLHPNLPTPQLEGEV